MGCLIGTRFRGLDAAGFAGALAAGLASTLVACALAAGAAVLAAGIVGLPPAALLLAFAPGGVEVMAALAVETGLEPAFVAAHHVFRLLILSVLVPVFLARERRAQAATGHDRPLPQPRPDRPRGSDKSPTGVRRLSDRRFSMKSGR